MEQGSEEDSFTSCKKSARFVKSADLPFCLLRASSFNALLGERALLFLSFAKLLVGRTVSHGGPCGAALATGNSEDNFPG